MSEVAVEKGEWPRGMEERIHDAVAMVHESELHLAKVLRGLVEHETYYVRWRHGRGMRWGRVVDVARDRICVCGATNQTYWIYADRVVYVDSDSFLSTGSERPTSHDHQEEPTDE